VTPVNCVCGAEAKARLSQYDHFLVSCARDRECWCGPDMPTEAEAVEAWNRVMRPRPVVTTFDDMNRGFMFELGARSIGALSQQRTTEDGWAAALYITSEQTRGTRERCRAWLIEKLTAAGFDVKEGGQ
jgi:hypothetical protein